MYIGPLSLIVVVVLSAFIENWGVDGVVVKSLNATVVDTANEIASLLVIETLSVTESDEPILVPPLLRVKDGEAIAVVELNFIVITSSDFTHM